MWMYRIFSWVCIRRRHPGWEAVVLDGTPIGTLKTVWCWWKELPSQMIWFLAMQLNCINLASLTCSLNFPILTLFTSKFRKTKWKYTWKYLVNGKMLPEKGRIRYSNCFSNFWSFSQSFMTRKYCAQQNSMEQVWQHETRRVLFASLSELPIIKTMGDTALLDNWVSPQWGHKIAYIFQEDP